MVDTPACTAGVAQFIPANAGSVGAGGIHGVVHDDGFVATEVAILCAVHGAVGDGVQLGGGALLRNTGAGTVTHVGIKGGGCQCCGAGKGGVGSVCPIDMECPDLNLILGEAASVIIGFDEVVRCSSGRGGTIEISGEHAAHVRVGAEEVELNHACCLTEQHLVAFEDGYALTSPGGGVGKFMHSHVIAIGPNAEVGVVVHVGVAPQEVIAIPRAGGVACL